MAPSFKNTASISKNDQERYSKEENTIFLYFEKPFKHTETFFMSYTLQTGATQTMKANKIAELKQ